MNRPTRQDAAKHCGAIGQVGEECSFCEPQDDLGPMIFQRVESPVQTPVDPAVDPTGKEGR